MKDRALFADVSVDPKLRIGVGAYLAISASFFEAPLRILNSDEVANLIKVKRFEDTSSSKLELQTVLWALQEQPGPLKRKISLYTDSQCVSGLLKRRPRLMASDFLSKRTGRPLKNALLYRSFYECYDALGFDVNKVQGHTRARAGDTIQRIFSFVDKMARKKLKMWTDECAEAARTPAGNMHNEAWCVYVLRCRNNSLYTGMTNNIERRMRQHEQGRGSKFVRAWKPFSLVKTIPCRNAGEARRLEYSLKRLTREEKIETLELLETLL